MGRKGVDGAASEIADARATKIRAAARFVAGGRLWS
jgi:hypothetical protein